MVQVLHRLRLKSQRHTLNKLKSYYPLEPLFFFKKKSLYTFFTYVASKHLSRTSTIYVESYSVPRKPKGVQNYIKLSSRRVIDT